MTQIYHSKETWRDIPGYEGIYQASTLGNIRTVDGKTTSNKRYKIRRWKSRILKVKGNNPQTGYRVSLWKDGKSKDWLVARLVAITFLGMPQSGLTVNHKDGNRLNNNINNLEWLSIADNIRHGFATGLYKTQKSVSIECNGQKQDFRSMAQLDAFLKRRRGYTSERLRKHDTVVDASGNAFHVLECRERRQGHGEGR